MGEEVEVGLDYKLIGQLWQMTTKHNNLFWLCAHRDFNKQCSSLIDVKKKKIDFNLYFGDEQESENQFFFFFFQHIHLFHFQFPFN